MYLIYNANGGSFDADSTIEENKIAYQWLPVDNKNGLVEGSYIEPVNVDMEFVGWYTDAACTTEANIDTILSTEFTSDNVIYAKWKASGNITITYDANGGYFDNTSITNNIVKYKQKTEIGTITKISKTDNVNEDGTCSTGYKKNQELIDTVTIPGASELTVTITYQTKTVYAAWAFLSTGDQNLSAYSDYNKSLSGRLGGPYKTTKTFTVPGDTVKFYFYSGSNDSGTNMGYYATVEGQGIIVDKTILSGEYKEPTINEEGTFNGWYLEPEGIHKFNIEEDAFTKATTLYAKWKYPTSILVDGSTLNIKMKTLAGSSMGSSTPTTSSYNNTVTAIEHSLEKPSSTVINNSKSMISTEDSDYPVYMWYEDGKLKWWTESKIVKANKNSTNLFIYFISLTDISGLAEWDMSDVESLSSAFQNCEKLENVDALKNWNVSNVTWIGYLFDGCNNLSNIDGLKTWNTSNISNAFNVFKNCKKITSLNALEQWNTSNFTTTQDMFNSCNNLSDISALQNWNISNVSNMSGMFYACKSLTNIDALKDWDVSKVTNMSYLLGYTNINNVDVLKDWDVSKVTNMSYMFSHTPLENTDGVNDWDINKVTNFYWMCNNASMHPIFTKRKGAWDSYGTFVPWTGLYLIYNANGGSFSADTLIEENKVAYQWLPADKKNGVVEGEYIEPVKNGAYVLGWHGEDGIDTSIDYILSNQFTASQTVYATWKSGYTVTYDANGGYFGTENITQNKVDYLVGYGTDNEKMSKISKSENVNDDGTIKNGGYGVSNTTDTITIPGSSSLTVTITYAADLRVSASYRTWVAVYAADKTPDVTNYSESISGKLDGGSASNRKTKTFTVKGDTVKIFHCNRGSLDANNNYYAVIEGSGYANHLTKGVYKDPDNANSILEVCGWYTDPECTDGNEFDLATNFDAKDITVYAKWRESMSYLATGNEVNIVLKELVGDGTNSSWRMYDLNIKHIKQSNGKPEGDNIKTALISARTINAFSYPTYAAYDSTTGTIYLYSEAKVIYFNPQTNNLFRNMRELVEVDVPKLNASKTTTMEYMFDGCIKLKNINTSSWSTIKNTTTEGMFKDCQSLEELDTSNWDTSNVTTMANMFENAYALRTVNVSNWNTSNVTTMANMFENAYALQTVNVSNWDTSNVTTMANMFRNCYELNNLNVRNWNTSSVTDMTAMFDSCKNLDQLRVESWNTSSVTIMSSMFARCGKLNYLDVSNWDVSNITKMGGMFYECSSLPVIDTQHWYIKGASVYQAFAGCTSLQSANIQHWEVGGNELEGLFYKCSSLKFVNAANVVSNSVRSLNHMFNGCTSLYTVNIDNWDTSGVQHMISMFRDCSSLQTLDVSSWNTMGVEDMSCMFYNCTQYEDYNTLNDWKFRNTVNNSFKQMFYGCQNHPHFKYMAGTWLEDGTYYTVGQ